MNTRSKKCVEISVPIMGNVYEKDTLFFRQDVGKAEGGNGTHYEMSLNMGGLNPIIHSVKTGKWFTLSWQAIIDAAIAAGINEEVGG